MLQNRTPRTPTATGPATPPVATTHRTRPRGHLPAQDGRLPAPAGSSPPSDTEKAPAPRSLFFIFPASSGSAQATSTRSR